MTRNTKDAVLKELGEMIHTGSISGVAKHLRHELFMSEKSRKKLIETLARNKTNEHAKRIQAADLLSGADFKNPVYGNQRLIEAVIISAAKHSSEERQFGNMLKLLKELLQIWVAKNKNLKSDIPLLQSGTDIVQEIIVHIPDKDEKTQKNIILLLTFLMMYHYTEENYNTRTFKVLHKPVYPFLTKGRLLTVMKENLPVMSLGEYTLVHDFAFTELIKGKIIKPVTIINNTKSVKSVRYDPENLIRELKNTRVSGVKAGITIHSEMSTNKAGGSGGPVANNGRSSQVNLSQPVRNGYPNAWMQQGGVKRAASGSGQVNKQPKAAPSTSTASTSGFVPRGRIGRVRGFRKRNVLKVLKSMSRERVR